MSENSWKDSSWKDSWTQITCMWCGHSIKLSETSSIHVWPPKYRLCCTASIDNWQKEQKEQKEKSQGFLSKLWKMIIGK